MKALLFKSWAAVSLSGVFVRRAAIKGLHIFRLEGVGRWSQDLLPPSGGQGTLRNRSVARTGRWKAVARDAGPGCQVDSPQKILIGIKRMD